MSNISNYNLFIESISKSDNASKKRIQDLANIILGDKSDDSYAVQLTFHNNLLLEHEQYKRFSKTNRMYSYHPENINIPVKAHYHIVDAKGKKEIYAVSVDGSAHHKANRSIIVPKKEANELRKFGVQLNSDNILESINYYDDSIVYDVLFFIID